MRDFLIEIQLKAVRFYCWLYVHLYEFRLMWTSENAWPERILWVFLFWFFDFCYKTFIDFCYKTFIDLNTYISLLPLPCPSASAKDRKRSGTLRRTSSCGRFYLPAICPPPDITSIGSFAVPDTWSFASGGFIWSSKFSFINLLLALVTNLSSASV